MRARATLANVERELRAAGAEVTIHALWVALTDRAGLGSKLDVQWRSDGQSTKVDL